MVSKVSSAACKYGHKNSAKEKKTSRTLFASFGALKVARQLYVHDDVIRLQRAYICLFRFNLIRKLSGMNLMTYIRMTLPEMNVHRQKKI